MKNQGAAGQSVHRFVQQSCNTRKQQTSAATTDVEYSCERVGTDPPETSWLLGLCSLLDSSLSNSVKMKKMIPGQKRSNI